MLTGYHKILFTFLPFMAATAQGDFLPPNDLHLEDSLLREANMSEKDFNAVID